MGNSDHQLTREEVTGIIDAEVKIARQLEVIAGQMASSTATNQKILDKLSNGLSADMRTVLGHTMKLERIEERQTWMAWVLSSIGGITGLVVILKQLGIVK